MKSIFSSLIIVLISLNGYSQELNPITEINLAAVDSLINEINDVEEADSSLVEIDSIPAIDIKKEYWDNHKFNPYKEVTVKFPVQLIFDDSSYASPISKNKVVTSRYGWRRGRAHKGIDIDLLTGDSVFSVLDGIVRFVNYNSGHGKTVIVRHFNGLETIYAHLSRYAVKVNDTVKKGQLLGKGGATGNARGSHLHLVANYKGVSIHPEYLFDFSENNTVRSSELWVTRKWTSPGLHSSRRQSKLKLLLTEEEALASLIKERKIYIVKRGDTLSRISSKNNVSITSICKTNNIKRNSIIRIGQKLVLEL